jgi:hypothetical protein
MKVGLNFAQAHIAYMRSIRNWIAFGAVSGVILLILDWLNEMGTFANMRWF